jgi:hypothetical protein
MHTDETPDRRTEKPTSDHQFEIPVVREEQPGGGEGEERDDPADGPERPRPERRPSDYAGVGSRAT